MSQGLPGSALGLLGDGHQGVVQGPALIVDDVGDVLWLPASRHDALPATLSQEGRSLCSGLYRLEAELLLVLRIEEVLVLNRQGAAIGLAPRVDRTGGQSDELVGGEAAQAR